jgi:hypothetical protein
VDESHRAPSNAARGVDLRRGQLGRRTALETEDSRGPASRKHEGNTPLVDP